MRAPLALVTGGASGIGAATATRLRREGRPVAIVDRHLSAAKDIAASIGATAYELDISAQCDVDRVIDEIEAELGPIGTLINCAGHLQATTPPQDLPLSTWESIIDVHLRGTYMVTTKTARGMIMRMNGVIVTVASVTGMCSAPLHAYGPAKAALINLTANLAAEWGRFGIRVNAVSPGFVETPAVSRGLRAGVLDEDRLKAHSAMGRLVTANEVAAAIYFLASDEASAITGCNLPVDAGFMAAMSWGAFGGVRCPDTDS